MVLLCESGGNPQGGKTKLREENMKTRHIKPRETWHIIFIHVFKYLRRNV